MMKEEQLSEFKPAEFYATEPFPETGVTLEENCRRNIHLKVNAN